MKIYRFEITSDTSKPIKIVELRTIKDLLNKGNIVIACGGGGIPVVKYRNGYTIER